MNIIVYETNSEMLIQRQAQLSRNAFKVLAATSDLDRVRDLAGEFCTSIGLLGPEVLEFIRAKDEIEQAFPMGDFGPFPSSLELLFACGHPPLLSFTLWEAASKLASERFETGISSVHAGMYLQDHCLTLPSGYESLPAAWLVTLPGLVQMLLNRTWVGVEHGFIRKFQVNDGVLDMVFVGEDISPSHSIFENKIHALRAATRKFLNRNLYPSRWMRLLPQHQVEIANEHPELKAEIERVHQQL